MLYATNMIAIIIYLFQHFNNKETVIYFSGEIIYLIFCVNLRCFTLAIKYATYDPDEIKLIKTKIQTY